MKITIIVENADSTVRVESGDIMGVVEALDALSPVVQAFKYQLKQLVMHEYGCDKIRAIKAVRTVTGWGLKESKAFVELPGEKVVTTGNAVDMKQAMDAFVECRSDARLEVKSIND